MSFNDVFECTLFGTIDDQKQVLTYAFKDIGPSSSETPETVAGWFATAFLSNLTAIQCDASTWSFVKVVRNFSTTDFYESGFAITNGDISGDRLPPYATWSFKKVRTVIGIRPGGLHLSGVPEAWQNGGKPLPAYDSAIAAVASYLSGTHSLDSNGILKTAVVSRYLNGNLRPTPVVMLVNAVSFVGIGTQNTRKYGRGS